MLALGYKTCGALTHAPKLWRYKLFPVASYSVAKPGKSVKGRAAAGGATGTLDGFLPVMLYHSQATGI